MRRAWDHESNNRPNADQLYEKLSKCLDDEIYPVMDEPRDSGPLSNSDKVLCDKANTKELYKIAVGKHNGRKYSEAWPIFFELACARHKASMFYVGYYYDHGYAVPQDSKQALKYYRDSADANFGLATFYYAETCLKTAQEYLDKAAQLKQFKSGIKLAECLLPQLPALPSETCDKLLKYLDMDEEQLNKQKDLLPNDQEMFKKRINRLRNEIKLTNSSETN